MERAVKDERRRSPRKEINATVEFVVEPTGVIEASSVELTDNAITFRAEEPIELTFRAVISDEEVVRFARLVRVRVKDGSFVFGLEFHR